MAAAEARAAWQRAANRCLVQEDAKRAPKFPCSSSSSKSLPDCQVEDSAGIPEHGEQGRVAHGSNQIMADDIKWWLHIQPSFRNEKDFSYEHTSTLEVDHEVLHDESPNHAKISVDDQAIEKHSAKAGTESDANSFTYQPLKASLNCTNGRDTRLPELKAVLNDNPKTLPINKDMGEFRFLDGNLVGLDSCKGLEYTCLEKLLSGLPLIAAEKEEPWWRTADGDELASFIAQKSLDHFENCDLPQPQVRHCRKASSSCLDYFDHYGEFAYLKAEDGFLKQSGWEIPTSDMNQNQRTLQSNVSDRSISSSNIYNSTCKNQADFQNNSGSDPDKAQLLEALCRSQTRARHAEKEAHQLQTEKEHILKLFFRQASQLFAYRQWVQILQLENLCLQLKKKDQPVSPLSDVLLQIPGKGGQQRKGEKKPVRRKQAHPKRRVCKSAVAFVVGLGLAGAGLLLGWTMGWLFPTH